MKALLPCLLLLPMLSGCQATQFGTQTENDRLIELDQRKEAAEAVVEDAQDELKAAWEAADAAFDAGDEEAFAEAKEDAAEAAAELAEAEADKLAVIQEQNEILQGIKERTARGVLDFIDPFLPAPIRPFSEPLALLVLSLSFRRSRLNLGKAITSVGKLNLLEGAQYLARALGLIHTSKESAAVALEQEAYDLQRRAGRNPLNAS